MKDRDIIDKYSMLPLGKYEEIQKIDKMDNLEEIDKQVKIISVLTDLDEDTILNLPINEYKRLSARSKFLETPPTSPARIAKSYKIGKFELIPVTDIRKVITAQYIDFQSFHQAGLEEHFVEILSCILVPKGKKYNQDYDIIEVQEALRDYMNVLDGCSLYAFFLTSCKGSIKDILTYSLKEAEQIRNKVMRERLTKEIRKQMMLLQTDGAGSQM